MFSFGTWAAVWVANNFYTRRNVIARNSRYRHYERKTPVCDELNTLLFLSETLDGPTNCKHTYFYNITNSAIPLYKKQNSRPIFLISPPCGAVLNYIPCANQFNIFTCVTWWQGCGWQWIVRNWSRQKSCNNHWPTTMLTLFLLGSQSQMLTQQHLRLHRMPGGPAGQCLLQWTSPPNFTEEELLLMLRTNQKKVKFKFMKNVTCTL